MQASLLPKRALIPLLAMTLTPPCLAQRDITGNWQGTLSVNGGELHLLVHLTHSTAGYAATIDSLDQGAMGIPASSVVQSGDSLTLVSAAIGVTFHGTISAGAHADTQTFDGIWKQSGLSLPLVLRRQSESAAAAPPSPRPEPAPMSPVPYREEEVSYRSPVPGDTLAGTLTVPLGKGPFPAVLLIAGSGPHDRDETLAGHQPFRVLADFLARQGIAVLRYDKRGIRDSTGDYAAATTTDFAADAETGVAFLRSRPEIDHYRIGLVGHSEGGLIAPLVAAQDHAVAFLVLMAGSGVPGDQILVEQVASSPKPQAPPRTSPKRTPPPSASFLHRSRRTRTMPCSPRHSARSSTKAARPRSTRRSAQ